MFQAEDGKVRPKKLGTTFARGFCLDQGFDLDMGLTLDDSVPNAVIVHQKDSRRFPTTGVSTTPYFDRAEYYALGNGKKKGFVIATDQDKLEALNVPFYRVRDYTNSPEVPEDNEVIIDLAGRNELPEETIAWIRPVRRPD